MSNDERIETSRGQIFHAFAAWENIRRAGGCVDESSLEDKSADEVANESTDALLRFMGFGQLGR